MEGSIWTTELIKWLANLIILYSTYLLGRKNPLGWLLGVIAGTYGIFYMVLIDEIPFAAATGVMVIVRIWGFFQWKKNGSFPPITEEQLASMRKETGPWGENVNITRSEDERMNMPIEAKEYLEGEKEKKNLKEESIMHTYEDWQEAGGLKAGCDCRFCVMENKKNFDEKKFVCYHTTIYDRKESILKNGLVPGSPPNWFEEPVPYIMLSKKPWFKLYQEGNYVFEVSDPAIKEEYFIDEEGLRWPQVIDPRHLVGMYYQGESELHKEKVSESPIIPVAGHIYSQGKFCFVFGRGYVEPEKVICDECLWKEVCEKRAE